MTKEVREFLQKLVDGLLIKVISKDEVISGPTRFFRQEAIDRANDEIDVASNRLGWRVILALMDAYEEPQLRDQSRCAVCGCPLAKSIDKGCIRGNCSMRPRPIKLYDVDRAELESTVREKLNAYGEPQPRKQFDEVHILSTIGGTVGVFTNREFAKLIGKQSAGDYRIETVTLFNNVVEKPVEWKPGMWFECESCVGEHDHPLQVQTINNETLWSGDWGHKMSDCRRVPPPEESKPMPFSGEQLSFARSILYGVMGYLGVSEMSDKAVEAVACRIAERECHLRDHIEAIERLEAELKEENEYSANLNNIIREHEKLEKTQEIILLDQKAQLVPLRELAKMVSECGYFTQTDLDEIQAKHREYLALVKEEPNA